MPFGTAALRLADRLLDFLLPDRLRFLAPLGTFAFLADRDRLLDRDLLLFLAPLGTFAFLADRDRERDLLFFLAALGTLDRLRLFFLAFTAFLPDPLRLLELDLLF